MSHSGITITMIRLAVCPASFHAPFLRFDKNKIQAYVVGLQELRIQMYIVYSILGYLSLRILTGSAAQIADSSRCIHKYLSKIDCPVICMILDINGLHSSLLYWVSFDWGWGIKCLLIKNVSLRIYAGTATTNSK